MQRRYFTDRFRNFVDLCVQRNYDMRPSATQLLQHIYLKKMKLQNVTSTLQISVMSEGIIELQKKIESKKLLDQFGPEQQADTNVGLANVESDKSSISNVWNFDV